MRKYVVHCLSKNYKEYKWVVVESIGLQHDYYQVMLTNEPHTALKEMKYYPKELMLINTKFIRKPFYDLWGDFWEKVIDFIHPV